jgi:hypothetical protein
MKRSNKISQIYLFSNKIQQDLSKVLRKSAYITNKIQEIEPKKKKKRRKEVTARSGRRRRPSTAAERDLASPVPSVLWPGGSWRRR